MSVHATVNQRKISAIILELNGSFFLIFYFRFGDSMNMAYCKYMFHQPKGRESNRKEYLKQCSNSDYCAKGQQSWLVDIFFSNGAGGLRVISFKIEKRREYRG